MFVASLMVISPSVSESPNKIFSTGVVGSVVGGSVGGSVVGSSVTGSVVGSSVVGSVVSGSVGSTGSVVGAVTSQAVTTVPSFVLKSKPLRSILSVTVEPSSYTT